MISRSRPKKNSQLADDTSCVLHLVPVAWSACDGADLLPRMKGFCRSLHCHCRVALCRLILPSPRDHRWRTLRLSRSQSRT